MFRIISMALVICSLTAGAARAQTQDAATSAQDRRAQEEQTERDRRQAERERKDKDKEAKRDPGTRCSRWKRGKA